MRKLYKINGEWFDTGEDGGGGSSSIAYGKNLPQTATENDYYYLIEKKDNNIVGLYRYSQENGWVLVNNNIIVKQVIPNASETELNNIYLYSGDTNSNYINSHFYKCIEKVSPDNSVYYTWMDLNVFDIVKLQEDIEKKADIASTLSGYGILDAYKKTEVDNLLASLRSIKVVDTKPTEVVANTMYYVGTANPYHVYLYDSNKQEIDMGTSEVDFSDYQKKNDDNLQTQNKSVVDAINENTTNIGKLADLTTTDKDNLVKSINELNETLKEKYKYIKNKGAELLDAEGQNYTILVDGENAVKDISVNDLPNTDNGNLYTIKFGATGKVVTQNNGTQYGRVETTIIMDTSHYTSENFEYVEIIQRLTNLNGVAFTRKSERAKVTKTLEETIKFRTNWTQFTFENWEPEYIEYTDVYSPSTNCDEILSQRLVKCGKQCWFSAYLRLKDMNTEGRKYLLTINNAHGIKPPFVTSENWWYPVILVDGTCARNVYHEEARLYIKDGIGSIEMYQKAGDVEITNVMVSASWIES